MSGIFRRKYFLKVLTILSLSFFVGINLISYISYRYYSTWMLDQMYRSNVEVLNETSRVNEFVSRNIVLTGMNLIHEPLIQGLMREDAPENFQVVQAIRRLDSVQAMGDYIHSIYVTNPYTSMVYATSNMDNRNLFRFMDQDVRSMVDNPHTISLHPIPRVLEEQGREIQVYTYLFYNRLIANPGHVIININLEQLNSMVLQDDHSMSVVLDDQERIIYHEDSGYFLKDSSSEEFVRRLRVYAQDSGSFLSNYQGVKSLVVYNRPQSQGWTFVRIIPYDQIMADLLGMQRNGVIISFTFLFMGLVGAFMLAQRIYRPIQNLMTGIKAHSIPPHGDELSIIQSHMNRMEQQTEELQIHNRAILSEMQQKILRDIVLGHITDAEAVEHLMEDYAIPMDMKGRYSMLLCYNGSGIISTQPKKLLPTEVFRDTIHQHTLHIFQGISHQGMNQFISGLKVQGAEFIVLDGEISGVHSFHQSFASSERLLKDRIFYPRGFVVDVKEYRRDARISYPMALEKELLQHLKRGEVQELREKLKEFVAFISTSGFDLFKFNAVRLLYALQALIAEQEIESSFEGDLRLSRDYLVHEVDGYDRVEDLSAYFFTIMSTIHEVLEEQKRAKQWKYVKQVDAIIESNYQNPQFGVPMMAEMVDISGTYLNQMYKASKNCTISETLLEMRMAKACVLLKESTMTVKDVAASVGFENHNYFYTVFKKHIGITPGKYKSNNEGS